MKDRNFTIYDDETIQQWLELITPEERKGRSTSSQPAPLQRPSGDQAKPDDESKEPRPKSPQTEQMAVD